MGWASLVEIVRRTPAPDEKSDVFVCQAFVINEFVKTEAVYRLSLSVTLHLGLYSSFSMHLPEGQIYRPTKKFELLTIFFFWGGEGRSDRILV